VLTIHAVGQSHEQWRKAHDAHTKPVKESVPQLLPKSLSAANSKLQPCSQAKAAEATVVKPFSTPSKEGRFRQERSCTAKVWRQQRLTVQSRAVPEEAKG